MRRGRREPMTKSFLGIFAVTAALALTLPAAAHEMFLKPLSYVLEPGAVGTVALVNGTFERSDNTIDRERMRDVTVHGGGESRKPDTAQWQDRDLTSYLEYEVGEAGTYVVGVSTKPRIITLTATEFTDYLEHDGVADALEDFEANSDLENVRERYSKHVRTLVQVGEERSDEHRHILGYPVEIILEDNPYAVDIGDELGFQVLREGEPVADQLVYASYEGYQPQNEDGGHERAMTMRTDSDGRGSFKVGRKGVWYLTLIHMEKLEDDPEVDYESNWATLTFEID